MPFMQRFRETPIAKQMIIEEIEMTSVQPLDLGQCIIHALRVEIPPALKKSILIAEVTMLRAAARYHNRIRHQVIGPANEVAANWRKSLQGAAGGGRVHPLRLTGAKIVQEFPKRSALPGPGKLRLHGRRLLPEARSRAALPGRRKLPACDNDPQSCMRDMRL